MRFQLRSFLSVADCLQAMVAGDASDIYHKIVMLKVRLLHHGASSKSVLGGFHSVVTNIFPPCTRSSARRLNSYSRIRRCVQLAARWCFSVDVWCCAASLYFIGIFSSFAVDVAHFRARWLPVRATDNCCVWYLAGTFSFFGLAKVAGCKPQGFVEGGQFNLMWCAFQKSPKHKLWDKQLQKRTVACMPLRRHIIVFVQNPVSWGHRPQNICNAFSDPAHSIDTHAN